MSHTTYSSQPQSIVQLWPGLISSLVEGTMMSWYGYISNTVFTLYSRLYNRLYKHSRLYNWLGELCK